MSRFFTTRAVPATAPAAASPSAAHSASLPSNGRTGKRVSIPARLPDAAKQAQLALEEFVVTARKKNKHTDHSDAAEAVLIPFRPFARAKAEADKAHADGDVVCVETSVLSVEGGNCSFSGGNGNLLRDVNASTERVTGSTKTAGTAVIAGAVTQETATRSAIIPIPPGTADTGAVLKNTLAELDRLHVNASCRVRQRAPVVAEARARLTSLRRECRDLFRTLDRQGFDESVQVRIGCFPNPDTVRPDYSDCLLIHITKDRHFSFLQSGETLAKAIPARGAGRAGV